MADDLIFECPHCQKDSPVSPAVLGEMVTCPHCEKQFQARAPVGRSVGSAPTRRSGQETIKQEMDADETLVSTHPVFLRNHLFQSFLFGLVLLAGVAAVVLGLTGTVLLGLEGLSLVIAGVVLLLVAAVFFVYRWLQVISTRLIVTNQRTIAETGIFSKSTNEVQHDDVRNIKSDRNILERMFNYGDIALSSSGQDDMEIVVHDIPDPEGIIAIIRQHQ